MSNRLNQYRQNKLEPMRMKKAIDELHNRGFRPKTNNKCLVFSFKESPITYYPYSGWATGKTIKDGRGLKSLLEQLDRGTE